MGRSCDCRGVREIRPDGPNRFRRGGTAVLGISVCTNADRGLMLLRSGSAE